MVKKTKKVKVENPKEDNEVVVETGEVVENNPIIIDPSILVEKEKEPDPIDSTAAFDNPFERFKNLIKESVELNKKQQVSNLSKNDLRFFQKTGINPKK